MTTSARELIPSSADQQAAREEFLTKYDGRAAPAWPIPAEEAWYYEQLKRPVDSMAIPRSVFLDPFLRFIKLRPAPEDPSFGRYTLPFSPHEKSIRDDRRYTCWDGRVFLSDQDRLGGAERSSSCLPVPTDEKSSRWIWYQVWWDEEASSRSGLEVDLLWCHGLGEYGGGFAKHARKFLDAGYRVIALDLPSHGRSTGFHAHIVNLDWLAHAVHVVLADVIKQDTAAGRAQRQVVIAGQSMGGFTTVMYGLLYHSPTVKSRPIIEGLAQPKVIGLIPLCPMLAISPDSKPPRIVELFARLIARFSGRLPLADANKGKNTQDPWCEDQFRLDPQTYPGSLRVATGLSILDALDFLGTNMAELALPFQVMHGGCDRVTSPEGSLKLYESARSTRKSIKIYPFVEHVMLRIGRDDTDDLARQKILTEMMEWIDQIKASS